MELREPALPGKFAWEKPPGPQAERRLNKRLRGIAKAPTKGTAFKVILARIKAPHRGNTWFASFWLIQNEIMQHLDQTQARRIIEEKAFRSDHHFNSGANVLSNARL
jgi:hypothetical protein